MCHEQMLTKQVGTETTLLALSLAKVSITLENLYKKAIKWHQTTKEIFALLVLISKIF